MTSKLPFTVRPAVVADAPFLFNSFLKSYRDSPSVSTIPNTLYYAGQHDVVEVLLKASNVLVACNEDDPSQIYGYVIYQKTMGETGAKVAVLHWLYVKHPFRGFGLARELEAQAVRDCEAVMFTHRVKSIDRLLKNRSYVYNPFILMVTK